MLMYLIVRRQSIRPRLYSRTPVHKHLQAHVSRQESQCEPKKIPLLSLLRYQCLKYRPLFHSRKLWTYGIAPRHNRISSFLQHHSLIQSVRDFYVKKDNINIEVILTSLHKREPSKIMLCNDQDQSIRTHTNIN